MPGHLIRTFPRFELRRLRSCVRGGERPECKGSSTSSTTLGIVMFYNFAPFVLLLLAAQFELIWVQGSSSIKPSCLFWTSYPYYPSLVQNQGYLKVPRYHASSSQRIYIIQGLNLNCRHRCWKYRKVQRSSCFCFWGTNILRRRWPWWNGPCEETGLITDLINAIEPCWRSTHTHTQEEKVQIRDQKKAIENQKSKKRI